MDKIQELAEWKDRLIYLVPQISKQIDWFSQGEVQAGVSGNCPQKLIPIAEHLVEIQNANGEYQRNQIDKSDVENIKYYSKKNGIGFGDVIDIAVSNNRYLSKEAIEARGVAGFILEIKAIYNQYYQKYGVFPIDAMSAEVKRACRDFETDVSLKDKIETIIEVFLPELQGINIVERGPKEERKQKHELSAVDRAELLVYFKDLAYNGNINRCFEEDNKEEFLKHYQLLTNAGMSLDEFLQKFSGLTYSKCYEVKVVPAIIQMLNSHKMRTGTTRNITETDPYLRHKIEVAQNVLGKYSMVELIEELGIDGDNGGNCRDHLTNNEILMRKNVLLRKLKILYPDGKIEKDFIEKHPDEYADLKLIYNRLGYLSMDEFLNVEGFQRERFHKRVMESVFHLSEGDLMFYGFCSLNPNRLAQLELTELDPADYFGTYNKLIAQGKDHSQFIDNNPYQMEK